jgi:L-threonylcarbamoyladenylate synthase
MPLSPMPLQVSNRIGCQILAPGVSSIHKAVQLLQQGEMVGLPTETVYGLAVDADNAEALAKLFALKQRPAEHPVIVHLPAVQALDDWATAIPDSARVLAKAFWPGPLTMVLKRSSRVLDAVTGGQDTVAIRVPAHPVMLSVLKKMNGALAAPSANRFGHVSPTCAQHVADEFGDALPLILDGGFCQVGVESTIIAFKGNTPVILRPGMITASMIDAVLGTADKTSQKTLQGNVGSNAPEASTIRVSGHLNSHYAPQTPTVLYQPEHLFYFVQHLLLYGKRLGVISRCDTPALLQNNSRVVWCKLPEDATGYAAQLYATMRQLDGENLQEILIEAVPADEVWWAIINRLERATYHYHASVQKTGFTG